MSSCSASALTSETAGVHRWLVWITFDGTAFSGFQRQDGPRTVAGTLEDAWRAWHDEAIELRSSSRTDAGVHARRMPVALTTARDLPPKAIVLGWNRVLPADVAVIDAVPVGGDFHIRHDAVAKRYVYRLWCARARSPLHRLDHWHVKGELDVAAMARAAAAFRGDHDFAAFRASSCTAASTLRTMHRVEVEGALPELRVVVEGNAFLHNMVRIMVGTLVEVGRSRRGEDAVAAALASGRREDAGQTAPAHGLTLDDVVYGRFGARAGLDHKRLLASMAERMAVAEAGEGADHAR
jgi:tRNA pseudouridine38-40 synthase